MSAPVQPTWPPPDPGRVAPRPDAPGLFLALAPMDGVTDWTYRKLLTEELGAPSGVSLCVSEFIRVTDRPVPAAVLTRDCPELARGGRTRAGVPVYVQILGGEPEPMAATAATAAELGALGVDINFGCPARTVNRKDGGAALLKDPRRVEAVTRAVRRAVPSALPVTVKVRLGWDDLDHVTDIARAAEQGGGTWLTIHARTRAQGYKPPVHWHALAWARQAISIPVVANGDLYTADDVARCAAASGCTAFMIGRGSMGRPNLFRQIRGWEDDAFDLATYLARLHRYADLLQLDGLPPKSVLGRLKQWFRLAAPTRPVLDQIFQSIKRLSTLDEARALLDRLPREGPAGETPARIDRPPSRARGAPPPA